MISLMPNGSVEFRVFSGQAQTVEILGSFTGWQERPVTMRQEQPGWFIARCKVEPGDHEFQYRVDGEHWLADFAASGVRLNCFGLWVSQLVVPEKQSRKLVVETRPVRAQMTPAPGGTMRMPAA